MAAVRLVGTGGAPGGRPAREYGENGSYMAAAEGGPGAVP